jgi:hypothetical protein
MIENILRSIIHLKNIIGFWELFYCVAATFQGFKSHELPITKYCSGAQTVFLEGVHE